MSRRTTPPDRERLLKAIDAMAGVGVLVVADLVLDVFEYGEIGRISREAPVLILNHERTDRRPGGGANAASNLRALDGAPFVVGRVGADENGEQLVALLCEQGIDTGGIWREADYSTPVKRRILAGSAHSVKQQVVRVDSGGGPPVVLSSSPVLTAARQAAARTRGTLISDCSLGLLHPGTIEAIRAEVTVDSRPLFVDSRAQLRLFRPLTAATPNLQEAETTLGDRVDDDPPSVTYAGRAIREALEAEAVVVTRGSHGMSLYTRDSGDFRIPVYGTDEVADVTGAGDTVISVFALSVLSGCPYAEAALLANYAGGIVVMKRGTATVSREELREAVRSDSDLHRRLLGA